MSESKTPACNNTVMGNGSNANLRLVCNKNIASSESNQTKRIPKNQWKPETLALKDKYKLEGQSSDIYNLYVNWSGSTHKVHFKVNWNHLSRPRRKFFLENLRYLRNTGITRDKINGSWKYFVLLGIGTAPYRKEIYSKTGLRLGINTGPAYSYGTGSNGEKTTLKASKRAVKQAKRLQAQKATKQRRLDRSLRVNFPENYNEDGTSKKGVRFNRENYSKNAQRIISELREINRKQVISKTNISREQIKQIVRDYDYVVMENINYSVWFKRYPHAIRLHTPGRFQALLQAELKVHGKDFQSLPLQYAFSQTCICGNKVKKTLKQRLHICENIECPLHGIKYHRDHYSALLMLLVQEYNLSVKQLHEGVILKRLKREFNRLKKQGVIVDNIIFQNFRELSTVQSDSIMSKGSRILAVSRVLASIEAGTETGVNEFTPVVEVRLGQVEPHPAKQACVNLLNGSDQQNQYSARLQTEQPLTISHKGDRVTV